MKIFAAAATMLFLFVAYAFPWDIIPSKRVYFEQFSAKNGPTDIIFKDASNWLLYTAADGGLILYKKQKKTTVHVSNTLEQGICFVEIDSSYFFCDSSRNLLQQLDEKFKPVNSITTGQANFDPTDIVKSAKDLYYIVDNDNHQVAKYNPLENAFTGTIGSNGMERGYFRYPFSAVVDRDRLLYVSEVLNTRVQMFSPLGKSTFTIGEWGVEPGQLYRPKGLALVHDKYLVVSDGYLGVLQVFDVYGKFIGVIADEKGQIKKYPSPTRIRAFGNRLAVMDYYDYTLEIIDIEGLK